MGSYTIYSYRGLLSDFHKKKYDTSLYEYLNQLEQSLEIKRILHNVFLDGGFIKNTRKVPAEIEVDYVNLPTYFADELIPLLKDHYLEELQEIFYHVLKFDINAFTVLGNEEGARIATKLTPELFTEKIVNEILSRYYFNDYYPFADLIPEEFVNYEFIKSMFNHKWMSYGEGGPYILYELIADEYRTPELLELAIKRDTETVKIIENEPFVDQTFVNNVFNELDTEKQIEMYNNLPDKFKTKSLAGRVAHLVEEVKSSNQDEKYSVRKGYDENDPLSIIQYFHDLLDNNEFIDIVHEKYPTNVTSDIFKRVVEFRDIPLINDDYEESFHVELAKVLGTEAIQYIPKEKLTNSIILASIESRDTPGMDFLESYMLPKRFKHDNYRTLRLVPQEYITDEVVKYLESIDALLYNAKYLPKKYITQELINEIKETFDNADEMLKELSTKDN